MYQDCFHINQTDTTLEQDQSLLQHNYYPITSTSSTITTTITTTETATATNIGHLYFNLPTNQDLDLVTHTTLSSPYSDSNSWSSCSSSPSIDFEKVLNFNLQKNDIESFLLSDLPSEMTLEQENQNQNKMQHQQHQQPFQQNRLKVFACCVCSRSFARKHDLQRHIRVHTGAKPYSCLNCTKSFARTDALKRHLRMEETCRMSPVIQAMKNTGSRRYKNL
ncbi:hypothetical protein INT46_010509 [Mucor plumbeus]|uniref:C2H2-type domain-containing protein n=1 Tax=Mucor plumbeus TaxID=97098 RepID=A0A8H7RFY3_9FUNG|nr:hypothetical protein INT46_010509 [Mucor plumbeus]